MFEAQLILGLFCGVFTGMLWVIARTDEGQILHESLKVKIAGVVVLCIVVALCGGLIGYHSLWYFMELDDRVMRFISHAEWVATPTTIRFPWVWAASMLGMTALMEIVILRVLKPHFDRKWMRQVHGTC